MLDLAVFGVQWVSPDSFGDLLYCLPIGIECELLLREDKHEAW